MAIITLTEGVRGFAMAIVTLTEGGRGFAMPDIAPTIVYIV